MSNSSTPPSPALQSELPRKLALLFLLSISTTIGIYFFFRTRPETNLLLRNFFADILLGLVAGFAVRILLKKRNWFIRVIAGTAALITGLLLLGMMTRWQTGIGPLTFWRKSVDWSGLTQIFFGTNCMLLAMLAWRNKTQIAATVISTTSPAGNPTPTGTHPVLPSPKSRRKRKQARPVPEEIQPAHETIRIGIPEKPVITRKQNAKTESKTVPRPSRKNTIIRLSSVEKHLCPYCLEPVMPKDPRGIVECETCHTLHNGDCWAIAGACQVPHFTA